MIITLIYDNNSLLPGTFPPNTWGLSPPRSSNGTLYHTYLVYTHIQLHKYQMDGPPHVVLSLLEYLVYNYILNIIVLVRALLLVGLLVLPLCLVLVLELVFL